MKTNTPDLMNQELADIKLLLQHTLKKVVEQEERIKDLENSVYILERTVYDRED